MQFDAAAVAADLGYKDTKVLQTRWSQIKGKMLKHGGTAATSGGIKKRTPVKDTKSKGSKAKLATDDDEEADAGKAAKPPSKRGRKAKEPKEEQSVKHEEIIEETGGEKGVVKAETEADDFF